MLFDNMNRQIQRSLDRLYVLGDPPDYEPTPDRTVTALAAARGLDPMTELYDLLLEQDGRALLMLPFFNYADGNHDAIHDMLTHPAGVSGLSDGGAHCGMICDASIPTYLLTHWARDRAGASACRSNMWSASRLGHRRPLRPGRPGRHRGGQEGRPERDRLLRAWRCVRRGWPTTCRPAAAACSRRPTAMSPPS